MRDTGRTLPEERRVLRSRLKYFVLPVTAVVAVACAAASNTTAPKASRTQAAAAEDPAHGLKVVSAPAQEGVEHLKFKYGPIKIQPGQNNIVISGTDVPITPAWPIWMDVQKGHIYPVFDVLKGSGTNGTFTYPDQADHPYKRRQLNEWTADRGTVLIATAGHLHPGGLHVDLFDTRAGVQATAAGKPSINGDKAH